MFEGIKLPTGSLLVGDGRIDRTAAGLYSQINPARGEHLADITLAGAPEIDQAVSAANEAESTWRSIAPTRRRDIILRLADLLDEHFEELGVLRSAELGA